MHISCTKITFDLDTLSDIILGTNTSSLSYGAMQYLQVYWSRIKSHHGLPSCEIE